MDKVFVLLLYKGVKIYLDGICDKITILIRRWHFWCEVTSSDQFPIGEFLNSIGASLNAVGSGSPVLGKEGGSDIWLMGLSGLIMMLLFPLKHPICLSRLKHALTRYDSRCNWRLGYFHPGWLTLWWLVAGSLLNEDREVDPCRLEVQRVKASKKA